MAFQGSIPPFPDYVEMVMEAIEGLDEKEGSTKEAISSYIESNYPDLPPTHSTHVVHTLEKLKQTGQLVMLKDDTYGLVNKQVDTDSDPNNGNGLAQPIKRGRGRPPKPKVPLPPGVVPPPPRPRGRPPKDPLSVRPKKPASTGRPRGRPKKSPQVEGSGPVMSAAVGGVKRGRGRPRKN